MADAFWEPLPYNWCVRGIVCLVSQGSTFAVLVEVWEGLIVVSVNQETRGVERCLAKIGGCYLAR